MWLTLTYLLHTIGELAEPRRAECHDDAGPGTAAGAHHGDLVPVDLGRAIHLGRVASLYESMALPSLFGTVATFAIIAGLILFACVPAMRRPTPASSKA
ncbi:MAG: hypothetical protein R2712_02010 [Vicinamibacterales bacterium]